MSKKFRISLLGFLFICLFSVTLQAKNYTIDNVRIIAEILQDGRVSITEFRTYSFDGSYSQANYELSRRGFDQVTDISVTEDGQTYILSESEMPGTFYFEEKNRSIDIIWNYTAEDETRTFVISYILEGAIIVGPDHAEFFWTYLSDDWERATQSLNVSLFLPGEHDGSATGWVYGSSEKVNVNYTSGGFTLESLERLNKPNEVIVRYIFPSSLIDIPVTNPDFSLAQVLNEENQRELERQEHEAWKESVTPFVTSASVLLVAFSLFTFFFLYNKYGRRYHPSQQIPEVSFRPPSELKPALASWLVYSRNVIANALAATLFDLARQGFYIIKEEKETTKILKKEKDVVVLELVEPQPDVSKLTESELALLDFLKERMKDENRLDKIFSASNTKMSKWYMEWTKIVSKEGKALDLIDQESVKGMKYSMFIQFMVLLVGIALFIMVQIPEPAIAAFVGLIMILVSFSIQRYKPHGQELYKKFYSYRNGLKMAAKQRLVSQSSFAATSKDTHLIYAVAFAITGKKLESMLSHLGVDESTMSWMYFTGNPAYGTSAIVRSIGQVTTSVVTSTTSFAGTGASAGVAGGGAGGGAR
jgi:uncharacterized membrane protein